MLGHAKNLYEMYRLGKSVVNSKVFEKSLNTAKKNYQQKRKKQEKKLKRTKAGKRQLKEMKARQKATKQLWDGVTKMIQPLGKVLTSARKLANNLTKAELAKSTKKDMKKKVIQKQNSTLPVRAQIPKNSPPTFRETVDAFDAFRQKYRTRKEAAAALPTMERYKGTFVYNQVKEALKNGRYENYIYMFEYVDENGMSGPLGSAREFSLLKNKNSNQLNINSNSNSSSQGTRNASKLGTGRVGDFSNLEGASIDNILSRIPRDAIRRELRPVEGKVTEGFEYKWVQDGKTMRVRVHGPDPSAPPGSNAANGWIVRVQEGKKYLDPVTGKYQPPGISNPDSPFYNENLGNRTHIPIKSPD